MGPMPLPLRRVHALWTSTPWLHWAAVLALPMLFNLVDRLVALHAILGMYAAPNERDAGRKLGGILLGMIQDFLVATLLLVFLLLLEFVRSLLSTPVRAKIASPRGQRGLRLLGHALRFALVLLGIVALLAFFAADQLLVRSREMRFTTDLIVTYFREKDQASALDVDPREVRLAIQTVVGTTCMVVFFAVFYVRCVDLLWLKPLEPASGYAFKPLETSTPAGEAKKMTLDAQQLEEGRTASQSPTSQDESSGSRTDIDDSYAANAGVEINRDNSTTSEKPSKLQQLVRNKKLRLALAAVIAYVVLLVATRAVAKAASPVVAAIALNATLNELFRNLLHVQFLPGTGSGGIESAAYFLNPETETYELFQNDVLFRKTTGFQGPLAFDVQVEDKEKNPPNVLVVAVESFRYMDSLLLAGHTAAADRLAKHNLTLTPHFDRWAKRGIAFNNMWSSWQTSRSLEAILFGQVAYDSVTDSGTTRGRKDTKLVGMPQLFKQKGYETVFTTGCIVTYDQWDAFLPSHGFDSVMAAPQMKRYAEKNYNMLKGEWDGPAQRGLNWGVHDDISFQIIGDLMINKTKAQAERVKRGEKKQPFFMNHYTISSHGPFEMHPAWYDSEKLPDFAPLCEGWGEQCNLIKNYAKMRYFTDMELGKFLDRMKAQGVLEDTIVVIVGDHGQSPETAVTVAYQTATTHVASTLIAEGRLGEYAGMIFEDATHHYDLLNTLADIVGIPNEGFLQTGVGRSLKRKLPFGERLVWSNNPMKKMSVVRGHERFVYDRATSGMGLFDTIKDPLEEHDLLPTLSASDANKLREYRRMGRDLNSYFKHRWEHKCLAKVSC